MNSPSSNPFRRSVHSAEYYTSTSSTAPISDSHAAADHDPTPRPKASPSTKKHVRISSPPRSPRPRRGEGEQGDTFLASQHPGAYHDGSPPGPARQASNQHRRDHTSSSGEEDSSSDGEEVDTTPATLSPSRAASNAPHNPFSRTLADMEESLGVSNAKATPEVADPTSQPDRSSTRAAMDVNAFKNLLMTGKALQNTAQQPIQPAPRAATLTLPDNSSGTDTSSISRQSIVENMSNETPRTSYERSISDEEEDAAAISQRKESKRVKPPLPRHRYGKSVTSTGPQIVSFSDFSTAGPEQGPTSPPDERPTRSSSELRRPLPPIPSPAVRQERVAPAHEQPRDVTPGPNISEQSAQPRKPPPPPLARRSSQRTPVPSPSRPRSGTASSRPSLMEDNESIAESTTSSNRIAPPPPPTRRSGHSNQTVDDGSPPSITRITSFKSPPPPPSRKRASSNLSSTSVPSSLSITPTALSNSTTAPPPPPPRRTSSRSSIEILAPRRTSGEIVRASFDSDRRPSVSSSVRRVPITEEPDSENAIPSSSVTSPSAKDILADMDAFQREIDALMARDELGKRKGSGGSASIQRPGRSS